jgi:PAS domain-containing protein
MISFYLFTTAREYEEVIFCGKIFSFWPFTVIAQTYFILIFTERKNILKNRAIYPILYIPAFLIVFWELSDLIAHDLILKSWGWVEVNTLSPFFILASLNATILGFFSLYLCRHYFFTIDNIQKKNQAIFVFLGMLIPIILGLASQVFFPILEINIPDLTVFGWGLGCSAIAIGILRSKLFVLTLASAAESILTSMVSVNDFSTVVERSFDLIYALDTEGVIRYVSPSVEEI